jgi:EAL and modified HD-GYP domain-containing signal transduction protein
MPPKETVIAVSSEVFLARQPILDRDRRTFGYELLYRDGPDTGVLFDDPDDATKNVIQRAMLDWGMERIIGDRFGFINASANLIHSGMHRALPPEGIIIELREDIRHGDDVIDALGMARRDGYHFALDNVRSLDAVRTSSFLPLVSMVKIEMSVTDDRELDALVDHLRANRPQVLLVAEKVESMAQYTRALDAGFDLFEGYYFARPELLSRAARPSNAASTMSLLAEMQRDDISVDRIEELVGSDPSLAYRLLAVVNSSAFGLDRRVESLRHAIVLLGIGQVRYLATLLALSTSKDASEELIALGAMRGRLASELATADTRSGAFTVGLLSVTDALYQTPMDVLLEDLPVSASIRDALLDGTGTYGTVLELVRACEDADVNRINELAPGRMEEIRERYAEAAQWADRLRGQIVSERSTVRLPRIPGSLAPV